MATDLEDKFVTYLRTQNTSGQALEMVKNFYSDPPREDLSLASFPRASVLEDPSPSKQRGMGNTVREAKFEIVITLYVAWDDQMVKKGAGNFSAPEQAVSKIGQNIIDNINSNLSSLRTGNPAVVVEMFQTKAVPTGEFLKSFDAFRGEIHVLGRYYK